MHGVALTADQIRNNRVSVSADNPFRAAEKTMSGNISDAIQNARRFRDSMQEEAFKRMYG